MPSVFDDVARDLEGPKRANHTDIEYLTRSNRPQAARVRELVQLWAERYPQKHLDTLLPRLRSPIDREHQSAFFELALHELLLVTGHKIIEVEPRLAHKSSRPDFLVEGTDGAAFYLEAAVATGKSAEEAAAESRLSDAVDAINAVPSPRYFLDLEVRGKPSSPIRLRDLRKHLTSWVAELPEPAEAASIKPFVYREHGAWFEIGAIPRTRPAKPSERSVGVQSLGASWHTPGDGVRGRIANKASKYGKLDCPLILAINALGEYEDEDDVVDALFGTECVVISPYGDSEVEPRWTRKPDGVWIGERGPRGRGLSAVLSTERLSPWSIGVVAARLIRNPWALRPLPPVRLGTDEINPALSGEVVRVRGTSLGANLGLPEGWPLVGHVQLPEPDSSDYRRAP